MDDINLLLNKIKKNKTAPPVQPIPPPIAQVNQTNIPQPPRNAPLNLPTIPISIPPVQNKLIVPWNNNIQIKMPIPPPLIPPPPPPQPEIKITKEPMTSSKQKKGDIQIRAPANINIGRPKSTVDFLKPNQTNTVPNHMNVRVSDGALLNIKNAKQKKDAQLKQQLKRSVDQTEVKNDKPKQKQDLEDGQIVESKKGQISVVPNVVVDNKSLFQNPIKPEVIQQITQPEQIRQVPLQTPSAPIPQIEETQKVQTQSIPEQIKPTLLNVPQSKPTKQLIFLKPIEVLRPIQTQSKQPISRSGVKDKISQKQLHRLRRIEVQLTHCLSEFNRLAEMKRNNEFAEQMKKKLEVIRLVFNQ